MSGAAASLRIAFDMDGVLADMHATLVIEAEQMFGHDQSTVHAAQQMDMLWDRVAGTENFWEGLAETEAGIVGRLARLAHERRWEVLFLTQRPPTAGATVQQQTQAWLRRHGYDMPSVYTTRGSRGAIAAALTLDVVVDDRFEACVDVVDESGARAVLVWREPDGSVPARARRLGITVVRSAGECLDLFEQADAAAAVVPSRMARLKSLLRLGRRPR